MVSGERLQLASQEDQEQQKCRRQGLEYKAGTHQALTGPSESFSMTGCHHHDDRGLAHASAHSSVTPESSSHSWTQGRNPLQPRGAKGQRSGSPQQSQSGICWGGQSIGKTLLRGHTGPVCSREIASPAEAKPGPRPEQVGSAGQKKGSFQGLGKAQAHLNARKFRLHERSLAMEGAQPSVSLLLKSLEGSEKEEPW